MVVPDILRQLQVRKGLGVANRRRPDEPTAATKSAPHEPWQDHNQVKRRGPLEVRHRFARYPEPPWQRGLAGTAAPNGVERLRVNRTAALSLSPSLSPQRR